MGKKIYNAKARQNVHTIIDNTAIKNIKIEYEDSSGILTGYDEANALVLPSKKRATKIQNEKTKNVRILSKKQRKQLQNIVDKKKKKEGRIDVLKKLASVQIPVTELEQYTSISQAQTIGVKSLQTFEKYIAKKAEKKKQSEIQMNTKLRTIKGAIKRKLLIEEEEEQIAKRINPNYLGVEDEEDDGDDDNNDDDRVDNASDKNEQKSFNVDKHTHCNEKVSNDNSTFSKITTDEVISNINVSTTQENSVIKPTSNTESTPLQLRRTISVPVNRSSEIQAARLKLPILSEEQQVMEAVNENPIVIISGETGSGKTTQIPQFLYEAGYAQNKMIGITEPRRVAAIAMSKRVAYEMNLSDKEISYLIRFEGNVTPATRIKFMTDGVLLKEIETDFLLTMYSVIILDEAHERTAYTDILIGLLSRIVLLRQKRGNPLKLILMSATLHVDDFTSNKRLFKTPPPVLTIESRQYPVTIHFQKRTPANYVEEAYCKTIKIHSRLPEGGILIFVTGQQEVNQLVRKLRSAFPYIQTKCEKAEKINVSKKKSKKSIVECEELESIEEYFDVKRVTTNVRKSKKKLMNQISLPTINLDNYKLPGEDSEADLLDINEYVQRTDISSENDEDDDLNEDENMNVLKIPRTRQPLWVLPLYSLLSSEKQNRVFQPVPEGCRLCVVSTNVAETSLTIPNIKYVVDSGRQKTRLYDKITGVSAFVVTYTSKASANQRAGRAGRISAGHCYRLYSSAVYNDLFENYSMPDIQKKPVDDLMLQMRCMGIDRVINFPFPSPPDNEQLKTAEQRLVILGALERSEIKKLPPKVSKLGYAMSRFPVAPRFAKMLVLSHQHNLLPYTVCLVAALSVQELLMEVGTDHDSDSTPVANKWRKRRLAWAGTGNFQLLGDLFVLMRAVGAAEYASSQNKLTEFCVENGLRLKAIVEVRKLRVQLTNEINLNLDGIEITVDPKMPPPTDVQARFLRQLLLTGMGDRVAHKVPLADISDKNEKRRLKYAYNCLDMEEPAFLHSSSVLKSKLPEWIIYQEAYEMESNGSKKMFIRGITAIEPEWLLLSVPLLCNIKQIREDPAPYYKTDVGKIYCYVDATFGKAAWELPLAEIVMPINEKTCCYFGMFLLDGVICPKLSKYKPKLKLTPVSLLKNWSNLNENILRFKSALIKNQITTRQALKEQWDKQSNFLLHEYENLLYDVSMSELSSFWPPPFAS